MKSAFAFMLCLTMASAINFKTIDKTEPIQKILSTKTTKVIYEKVYKQEQRKDGDGKYYTITVFYFIAKDASYVEVDLGAFVVMHKGDSCTAEWIKSTGELE